jgi:hypothetical protein
VLRADTLQACLHEIKPFLVNSNAGKGLTTLEQTLDATDR